MLPERRRRKTDSAWRLLQFHGKTANLHFADTGMMDLDGHLVVLHLWIGKGLFVRIHRRRHTVGRRQATHHLARVVLGKCFLDLRVELRFTREAIFTSSETRIVGQILTSNRAADVVKEFVI